MKIIFGTIAVAILLYGFYVLYMISYTGGNPFR